MPSKILNYLCAGRPVLGAIPLENAAAKNIITANAGIIVEPDDINAFVTNARRLYGDDKLCTKMGKNGRTYAEQTFSIQKIGNKFEDILHNCLT